MKKLTLIILIIAVTICSVAGIICSGIYSIKTLGINYLEYGMIIPPKDTSAEILRITPNSDPIIKWNGKTYLYYGEYDQFLSFDVGKAIALFGEGGSPVHEVTGDNDHNFLVCKYFPDPSDLYIANDYEIPEEGEITTVYIDGYKVDDAELIDALERIYSSDDSDSFLYKFQVYFLWDYDVVAKKVSLAYEGCPISMYKGYIGKVNGKWCHFYDPPEHEAFEEETIPCFEIDEELIPVIDKYF